MRSGEWDDWDEPSNEELGIKPKPIYGFVIAIVGASIVFWVIYKLFIQ